MNDSFVFYKSFYSSLCLLQSDSEKWEAISKMCELAFNGKEADLSESSDLIKVIYTVTAEQIKASVKNKINGAKGGFKKGLNNNKGVNTPLNTPLDSNVNANVNDNVNVNANANANGFTTLPDTTTPAMHNYAKAVFDIFKNAGLPCAKANEITFIQTDFKNALVSLHKDFRFEHIHSDDVIQACKNYVEVYQDSNCYISAKMSFYKLVNSKCFYDLLPSNYDKSNFISYDKKGTDSEEKPERKIFSDDPCPNCHATKKVWWSYKNNCYICDSCNSKLTIDEFLGVYINEEAQNEPNN